MATIKLGNQKYRQLTNFLAVRIVAFCIAVFISQSAQAANISLNAFGTVRLWGQIVRGEAAKFETFTAGLPPGTYISLGRPGGLIAEALDIGDIIQKRGFSTVVSNRMDCLSACAILFFSGHHAVIQRNSNICFHMGIDSNTGRTVDTGQINIIAEGMMAWGRTRRQALTLLYAAPSDSAYCATEAWASSLGFRYSMVPSLFTSWRSCSTKFCLAVP
jgi:hypothetical protein